MCSEKPGKDGRNINARISKPFVLYVYAYVAIVSSKDMLADFMLAVCQPCPYRT